LIFSICTSDFDFTITLIKDHLPAAEEQVGRTKIVDWDVLAEPLTGLIQEHLESGEQVLISRAPEAAASNDSDDVQTIKRVLDQEIRPAVAQDGGDIVFHKFEDGVVYL
jgi:hypothetical protein